MMSAAAHAFKRADYPIKISMLLIAARAASAASALDKSCGPPMRLRPARGARWQERKTQPSVRGDERTVDRARSWRAEPAGVHVTRTAVKRTLYVQQDAQPYIAGLES